MINPEKLKEFRDLSDGNDDLIKEMMDRFLESAGELVPSIEESLAKADKEQCYRYLHKLKGSILTMGLDGLADDIVGANEQARSGDLSGVPAFCDKLRQELAKLRDYRKGFA